MKFKKIEGYENSYGDHHYVYETHEGISNPEAFEFMRAVDKCPGIETGCFTICEMGDSHWHDEYTFHGEKDFGDMEFLFAAAWINTVQFLGYYHGVDMKISLMPMSGRLVIVARGKIDADAFVKSVET